MGETKIRYGVVRVADRVDDQKNALEVLNALASSVTQEDLQEFVLSQVKRIIHGDSPGTWRDDFEGQGTLSLQELTHRSGFELSANCLASDVVGDIVHVTGDSVAGRIQVSKVDILESSKMPGVGVIISKSSPVDCIILRYGVLGMVGLLPGKMYFAGIDGKPTLVRPVPPSGGKAFVQVVGVAMDSSRLLLNPSFNLTRVVV